MNKKNLFLRTLYDFANSFVFITFLLYFSQWLVIDGGLGDFWYNALFAISSLLLLATSPTFASFTDAYGKNKKFLIWSTLGTFLGYSGAVLCAYTGQSIFLITLLFLAGQYFYQLSFTFYNAMIKDVADSQHRSRASGFGQFANSMGQMMGLVLALPFSMSRLQPLFPALAVFLILALPLLFFFREEGQNNITPKYTCVLYRNGMKTFFSKLKVFFKTSIAIPTLIAFFFFNDALITVSNNYAIYMERVFAIPDMTKNIIMMIILLLSAIGGLAFGYIGDKIGTKKSLIYILISWCILLPLLGIVTGLIPLIIASALLGFFMGGIRTVTRAYISQILDEKELGYGFSFYTLFERFATLLGPLSWGGIIAYGGASKSSYRIAIISMTCYVFIGLRIILRSKKTG